MKKLISIAYETPREEIEHAPFDSDLSLLDADIIILKPDKKCKTKDFCYRLLHLKDEKFCKEDIYKIKVFEIF